MLNSATGFVLAMLSAIFYGASAVVTKMISDQGVSVSSILLFRGIIGGILLTVLSWAHGRKGPTLENEMKKKALILSVFGSGATLLLLNKAYLYLPVGSVTTIHYLFPLLVNIIGARLSKKPMDTSTKVILIICTAGTLLLFDSLKSSQLPGAVCAVISIATWSFQILYLEYSGLTKCPAAPIAVRQCMVVASMGLLCGLREGFTMGLVWHALPLLVLAAVMNNVLANILLQAGIKRIGSGLTAILCIFEPISSILLGYVILGETMTGRQIAAVPVILTAIGILIIMNSRAERDTS